MAAFMLLVLLYSTFFETFEPSSPIDGPVQGRGAAVAAIAVHHHVVVTVGHAVSIAILESIQLILKHILFNLFLKYLIYYDCILLILFSLKVNICFINFNVVVFFLSRIQPIFCNQIICREYSNEAVTR